MTESANNCQGHGLRARKREATRSAITKAARLATAQKGLNGFTIEQLCEDVGVSRRTFFNYFPSKEDAIIGHLLDDFPAEAVAAFLAAGPDSGAERGPQGLTTTLLRDLLTLTSAMATEMNLTGDHVLELVSVMKKEPHLMLKVMGSAQGREQDFAAFIAERESRPANDPMVAMAAAVFGTCSQRASYAVFSEENTTTFSELLLNNLHMAQQIFQSSLLPLEGTP
ncbi:hypothetical protein AOC05_02535 [Arthrobacter alpinus]|uniref:HTH tetR-type domain-containing protein n=1 Tax=Arthrobacter alpinus TaxID=656366 RepID=A0A0M4RMV1_9MICC|nr:MULTISPECIES: TetR/AcrR family transcriptional regulator [Arthrobacter]ALE91488.1 hypothetical protein AOC05_02535 [Arthrobacter alpinus]